MFIALPPMVGDESGEDFSAKVEWWRFVAAREKSRPRDLLGRTLEGEPYVCEWSSFGDKGTRLMYAWVLGDIRSRAGICKERPRRVNAGRRGVVGLSLSALSSWDFFFSGSRNFGDGESVGGPPSESERAFEGDRETVLLPGVLAASSSVSPSPGPIVGCSVSPNWLLNIVSTVVRQKASVYLRSREEAGRFV
jgi:hypothetical protein